MVEFEALVRSHLLLSSIGLILVTGISLRLKLVGITLKAFSLKIKHTLSNYPKSSRQVISVTIVLLVVATLMILCSKDGSPFRSIGEFLIAVTLINPIYEFVVKASLHEEVGRIVLGIYNSKLLNIKGYFIPKSTSAGPSADYIAQVRLAIKESLRLEIVANYSLGIFSHYKEEFVKRNASGLPTLLVLIKKGGLAEGYVDAEVANYGDLAAIRLYDNAKDNSSLITKIDIDFSVKPKIHDRVLRYEFMRADKIIWVAPYLNTNRVARPPWLVLAEGSELYDFYDEDITAFLTHSGVVSDGP